MNGFVIRRSKEAAAEAIVESKDSSLKYHLGLINGSKRLCAAILQTKKTYRPMTQKEIDMALEYSHDVTIVRAPS
jgi:nitric oxide reductase activation protein